MPNRQYQQGTRFELKVIKHLEGLGYVCVRAAGSKGAGKVDIIAVAPGEPCACDSGERHLLPGRHLWIQCKRTGNIGPGEWNRLRECAGWAGAVPILASNGPAGRGVLYEQLTGDKVPRSRTYPKELYDVHVRRTLPS